MPRLLLLCGMLAGPIYILVAGVQAFTREGFDITRHPVSLLSNGDLGWIQILNFAITGVLVIAGALGLRALLESGRGATWGPILLGVYGLGLIASGIFVADPSHGFPPGTPDGDPVEATFSGVMHFMVGGVAFLALIAACVVFGRRFAAQEQRTWAWFSFVTGALFFVSFALVAAFPGETASNLLLTAAVILGWAWLSLVMFREWSQAAGSDLHGLAFSR